MIFSLSLSLVLADLAVLKHVRIQEGIQVIRMGFIGALRLAMLSMVALLLVLQFL